MSSYSIILCSSIYAVTSTTPSHPCWADLTTSSSFHLEWITSFPRRSFLFLHNRTNHSTRFCAVEAIAQSVQSATFPDLDGNVNAIALFNHEEVGSVSSTGAESSIIPSLLNRLSPTAETFNQSIARSFLISADMGHAVHPNYLSKHEENHRPVMNGGIILKINAKQKYTTDAISSFFVKKLVEKNGGKVQAYEVRNDM